ncbi:MAG: RNA 2',3'-cyclic phosphodiesterase [Candidatus Omnitrophica bacterium]|nr:RNA 2',3'-cyclic phosphodiesterase [Candidatus Omnitrophota bacterium]
MRTFIAIPISSQIKNFLENIQNELKTAGLDVKWVKAENIHITLKFLGEIKEDKIPLVKKIMDSVGERINPFVVSISSLGVFPKKELPKIIWVGIEKGNEELKNIAEALDDKIKKIGIPKEKRPFTSHITLGRLRSLQNVKKLTERLEPLSEYIIQEKKEFTVKEIVLYKSTLVSHGPIYEELYVRNLKTT